MRPQKTHLAFDLYGTLIDTAAISATLETMNILHPDDFAARWRAKQLEYSFRAALMQLNLDFHQLTQYALAHTLAITHNNLTSQQQQQLLDQYQHLSPFHDTSKTLSSFNTPAYKLHVFTNGSTSAASTLLHNTKLHHFFHSIVSAHNTRTFKPHPAVYQHLLDQTGTTPDHLWLISSNPFDIAGAASCNLQTIFIQRSPDNIPDPLPNLQPTTTLSSLSDLPSFLKPRRSSHASL
ncbi:haloacid dehalogenase type II [Poriferisphaera sp. WC338]|uniref:haloacid dehalogenase type II n=1 Tax=Poriferisphaera sp. WC338 TaxID=3425129 RepID=UPI003D813AF1